MPSRRFQNPRAPAAGRPPRAPAEVQFLDAGPGEMTDRLLIRLQDLPLPARVRGCLARLGVERVGDLVRLPPEALTKQRNFGQTSLRVLTRILARLGLGLGMTVEGWPPPDVIALSRERRDSTGEAKELLANAKRSHESIVDLISKLPSEYDARGYGAKARIIEGEIDELEKRIFGGGA